LDVNSSAGNPGKKFTHTYQGLWGLTRQNQPTADHAECMTMQ
jgi:hypothetical protein